MKLGDALAENFQSKAKLIRVKFGLFVTIIWAVFAVLVASWRVVFAVHVLKAINAPAWLWWSFWLLLPLAIAVDQIEKKVDKCESGTQTPEGSEHE